MSHHIVHAGRFADLCLVSSIRHHFMEIGCPLMTYFRLLVVLIALPLLGCTDSDSGAPSPAESSETASTSTDSTVFNGPIPDVIPDDERGHETPLEAWKAWSGAHQNKDPQAAMQAMTLASQRATAAATVMAVGMAAAFNKGSEDDVKALLARHGLSEANPAPQNLPEDASKLEQMKAMGEVFTNPAAFVQEAHEFMQKQANFSQGTRPVGTPGDVTVDGDTATMIVQFHRGKQTFAFKRGAGGWLVELTDDQFRMSQGTTTSGSGRMDSFARFLRDLPALPPLAPVSTDEVDNAWKRSVDYQSMPAADALQDIAGQCGLQIYDQPKLAEVLQQPVTVQQTDVSAVQVIEEICSQVGLHPRYKAGALALSKGERTLPVAFAGPFIIECTRTNESIPNAFATIQLQCFAAGLPTAVTSRLANVYVRDDDSKPGNIYFEIPPLTGADGSDLHSDFQSWFPVEASDSSVAFKFDLEASHLLQAVTHVAEFDGRFSWTYPAGGSLHTLDQIESGATLNVDDASMTIDRVNQSDNYSTLSIDLAGISRDRLHVSALDENGALVKGQNSNASGSDGITVYAQGKMASLRFLVADETARVEIPFHFPAIPLAHHDDMPAALPDITFEGDAPIAIRFVRMESKHNDTSAVFQWTNQSNKDIHELVFQLSFLDKDGKVLKEQENTQPGNRILLRYQQSEETSLLGHFAPEGTASAQVTVKQVTFADTTQWNAESDAE